MGETLEEGSRGEGERGRDQSCVSHSSRERREGRERGIERIGRGREGDSRRASVPSGEGEGREGGMERELGGLTSCFSPSACSSWKRYFSMRNAKSV